jgi:hypothetical protein
LLEKIEVLEDENKALRISVEATRDAKQQDLKMYHQLLDNARRDLENQ